MLKAVINRYEEGVWTPTLSSSGGDPTDVVYSSQIGRFTRIGRLVTISGQLGFSTYTGGSGTLRIAGLPFPVNATQSGLGACSIEQITLTAGYSFAVCRARLNSSVIDVLQSGSALNWVGVTLANAASSATNKFVQFTISYET